MIDVYIGRPPTMNRHMHLFASPVQRDVREAFRIARNRNLERRKHTRDRRREANDDVIVSLSTRQRQERRMRLDRRQNHQLLDYGAKKRDRRMSFRDRRRLINEGIILTLSHDRRSGQDRRRKT